MEKIKQLMIEAGLSEEAAANICEALETHQTDVRNRFEESYVEKINRAKQVCEAEVESHKRNLEKRLQIYCEAKAAEIDRVLAKQAQERDTEAVAKLTSITNMLEGVDTNGRPNGELEVRIKKLQAVNSKLSEEKKQALNKANKQTTLAEKVLKRNRSLERQVKEDANKGEPITEEKSKKGKRSRRLDEGRTKSKPKTTRRTLSENQDRRRPKQSAATGEMRVPGDGYSPDEIAGIMEEDLL